MSETLSTSSFWVKIYIAGPSEQIEQICREYVFSIGWCVTVTPTKFIYTGGEETGVEIGVINYARFPTPKEELVERAKQLADLLLKRTFQNSYSILTPDESLYFSRRDEVKR